MVRIVMGSDASVILLVSASALAQGIGEYGRSIGTVAPNVDSTAPADRK